MTSNTRTLGPTYGRTLTAAAALVLAALVVLLAVVIPAHAASPTDSRFITTELADSPAARELQWLMDATTRLPLSTDEIRAHIAKTLLSTPGYSPAQTNGALAKLFDTSGMHLKGVVASEPRALVAVVTGRSGSEIVVTLVLDHAGLIDVPTSLNPSSSRPNIALPIPSGPAVVGTDTLQLIDRSRDGRRVMVTRWYPAVASARSRPLAAYMSPRLSAVLGLPIGHVRVHAHTGAHPVAARLPVVLFSPGGNVSRVIYQALAEDLASNGYLVVSVDHTGEAAVELPDGRITLPTWWTNPPTGGFLAAIARSQATRVADLELILRRLGTMPGPGPDLTRIASIGHSLGGSSSAALMRRDSRIRAGIDLDGSIFGVAATHGVPRPFLILGEGKSDASTRGLLKHSTGPRYEIDIAGLQHMSFSDLPVLAPAALSVGKWHAGPNDIDIQRTLVREFLDQYLFARPSALLEAPSSRFPRATLTYRHR